MPRHLAALVRQRPRDTRKRVRVRKPHSPTYSTWSNMVARCHNPKSDQYRWYGARGIAVCDRWRVFAMFAADMGERPSPKHSIDRIDVTGNYEPGNCRWVMGAQQARNRRSSRLTEDDVRWMRWARAYAGVQLSRLGTAYGVAKSTAADAISGRRWQ